MWAEAGFSLDLPLLPGLAAGTWEHRLTVITVTQLGTRQELSQSSIVSLWEGSREFTDHSCLKRSPVQGETPEKLSRNSYQNALFESTVLPEVWMANKIDGFPMCCLNVTPKVYSGSGYFLIMLNCGLKQAAPSLLAVLGKILQKLGKRAGSQSDVFALSSTPEPAQCQRAEGHVCWRAAWISLVQDTPEWARAAELPISVPDTDLAEGGVSFLTVVGLECLGW